MYIYTYGNIYTYMFIYNIYLYITYYLYILIYVYILRPYWEYFGRGVANRTPSPFQACDGVQLQINIKNMSTGVLLDQFY